MNELDLTYGEIAAEFVEATAALDPAAEELQAAQVAALDPNDETAQKWLKDARASYETAQLVVREYTKAIDKKVDGIRAFIKSRSKIAEARREEGNALLQMARVDEALVEYVEECTMNAIRALGKRTVEGTRGKMWIQGNGGSHPVEVRQPELLPARYQRFEMQVTGEEWEELRKFYPDRAKPIDPDTELIRKDLLAEVAVPGAVLVDRGEHLRIR
jgi:tetratricopeptide (TPR) repeat protein